MKTTRSKRLPSGIQSQQGFSLPELMSIILIVGIMSAVALPAYDNYSKQARAAQNASTAQATKNPQQTMPLSLARQKTNALESAIEKCAQSQDCVGGANGSSIDMALMGNAVECQAAPCEINSGEKIRVSQEGMISVVAIASGKTHVQTLYPAWNGKAIQWVDSDVSLVANGTASATRGGQ